MASEDHVIEEEYTLLQNNSKAESIAPLNIFQQIGFGAFNIGTIKL